MQYVRYITLLGLKHVGKTSVSRELARCYRGDGFRVSVVDTDRYIVEVAASESASVLAEISAGSDQPAIRQLYHALGRTAFLELEARAIREIAEHPRRRTSGSEQPILIVATGGGVIDNPEAMQELERVRPLLYLWNDPAVLYKRIEKRGIPAFLNTSDPEKEFMAIAEDRDRKYRGVADHVFDISAVSVSEAAKIIQEQMR